MKTTRKSLLGFMVLSATVLLALPAAAADWNLDASHSHVGFKVKHMAISKVTGSFGDVTGTLTGEADKPATFLAEITIQVASVDTGNEKRDEHLTGADFFDVEKFPTMTFKSTGVATDGGDGVLTGELTLHGVTKTVELELEYLGQVNDPWGNTRMGFSAEGKIDRRDFGLTWSKALEAGGLVVGNDVEIELEIELVRAK
ncbi:MAG: YceI family protein [bacterium]|nr:YceI family protein [bacterium]